MMKHHRANSRSSRTVLLTRTVQLTVLAGVFALSGSAGIFPAMSGDIAVSIPFQFVAAGQTMQAGEYIVRHDTNQGVIEICEDGVYCVSVPAGVLTASAGAVERPELIFEHCGQRQTYVLAAVSSPSRGRFEVGSSDRATKTVQASRTSEKCVPARELCLHRNKGLAPSWH